MICCIQNYILDPHILVPNIKLSDLFLRELKLTASICIESLFHPFTARSSMQCFHIASPLSSIFSPVLVWFKSYLLHHFHFDSTNGFSSSPSLQDRLSNSPINGSMQSMQVVPVPWSEAHLCKTRDTVYSEPLFIVSNITLSCVALQSTDREFLVLTVHPVTAQTTNW